MLLSAFFAWLLNLMNFSHAKVHDVQNGPFKNVKLYEPAKPAERLLILVTSNQQKDLFNSLLSENFLRGSIAVAVINLGDYAPPPKQMKDCQNFGDDLSMLAHQLIIELKVGALPPPLLAATSQVNDWVRAGVERANPNSFIGYLHGEPDAASTGVTKNSVCKITERQPITQLKFEDLKTYRAAPVANAVFEIIIPNQLNENLMTSAEQRKEMARTLKAASHLVYELSSHPDDTLGPSRIRLEHLVLIELEPTINQEVGSQPTRNLAQAPKEMVVLFSGDGGWDSFMQNLAKDISNSRRPVVGIDLIPYIWNSRPPEAVAHDIESIFRVYAKKWNIENFSVYGFSHGADIIPFAVTRLSSKVRSQLNTVGLISPSHSTDFKFSIESWFYDFEGKMKTAKEVRELISRNTKVVCLYGQNETETSLCVDKSLSLMKSWALAGGHNLDGDTGTIVNTLTGASQ